LSKKLLKNLHLFRSALSLQNFFRRGLVCRQAEQTENEDLSCSTWTSNYTRRIANAIVRSNKLTPYLITLSSEGLAPRYASPQPTTNPKTRGNQKRLNRVDRIENDTVDKTATETCSIYPLNEVGGINQDMSEKSCGFFRARAKKGRVNIHPPFLSAL